MKKFILFCLTMCVFTSVQAIIEVTIVNNSPGYVYAGNIQLIYGKNVEKTTRHLNVGWISPTEPLQYGKSQTIQISQIDYPGEDEVAIVQGYDGAYFYSTGILMLENNIENTSKYVKIKLDAQKPVNNKITFVIEPHHLGNNKNIVNDDKKSDEEPEKEKLSLIKLVDNVIKFVTEYKL